MLLAPYRDGSSRHIQLRNRPRAFRFVREERAVPTGMEKCHDFREAQYTQEGAVLFAEIVAPPMKNLMGPELVRDLVSLIQQAEADSQIRVLDSGAPIPTISYLMST